MLFHQLDITDSVSVEAFAKWAAQELGDVDILVNNAGAPDGFGCTCRMMKGVWAGVFVHSHASAGCCAYWACLRPYACRAVQAGQC